MRQFDQIPECDDDIYLAEGVLTLPELQTFIQHDLPASKVEKVETDAEVRSGEDVRTQLRAVMGRRLARTGKLTEAREYFDNDSQKVLDDYAQLLRKANDAHESKPVRADSFWKAANLIADKGDSIFDYALPVTMAERSSGRTVEPGEYPETTMKYGEREKLVPPVTEKEQARLKQSMSPALHRHYSIYLAADLGWRAALLLPDNDDHTVDVLNRAGSWLKNRDEKAADRFYQAMERRCPKTDIGKQAIKHHWFVPVEDTSDENSPEPSPTPGG